MADANFEPVLDEETLVELRELMLDDFGQLLDVFFRDSLDRMANIDRALAANDTERVRQTAHSLKGSSANIGAKQLSARCQLLEDAGRDGDLNRSRDVFALVSQDWRAVSAALANLRR